VREIEKKSDSTKQNGRGRKKREKLFIADLKKSESECERVKKEDGIEEEGGKERKSV